MVTKVSKFTRKSLVPVDASTVAINSIRENNYFFVETSS